MQALLKCKRSSVALAACSVRHHNAISSKKADPRTSASTRNIRPAPLLVVILRPIDQDFPNCSWKTPEIRPKRVQDTPASSFAEIQTYGERA
eukprot:2120450-Pleurochrysis_carterae.AAC.2